VLATAGRYWLDARRRIRPEVVDAAHGLAAVGLAAVGMAW